jgi:hypothetical protein
MALGKLGLCQQVCEIPHAIRNASLHRRSNAEGFIVFLFYSNLLMGEFEQSGKGQEMVLAWAISDILTYANFG